MTNLESCAFAHVSELSFLSCQEEALHGFRVSDYFEYMEILEQNYRPVLLRDMRDIRVLSV